MPLGRRSIKSNVDGQSSNQKLRFGQRKTGSGLYPSSVNVTSVKKGVKKCLFGYTGRENQDPRVLENPLNSLEKNTGGTPAVINIKKTIGLDRVLGNGHHSNYNMANAVLQYGNDNQKKKISLLKPSSEYNLSTPQTDFQSQRGIPWMISLNNVRPVTETPFSSCSSDTFPDLESREQNQSFNSWSVFKKPQLLNNKPSYTENILGNNKPMPFHSSPNSEYGDERMSKIFISSSLKNNEMDSTLINKQYAYNSNSLSLISNENKKSHQNLNLPQPPSYSGYEKCKVLHDKRFPLESPSSDILNHPVLKALFEKKEEEKTPRSKMTVPKLEALGQNKITSSNKKRLSKIIEENSSSCPSSNGDPHGMEEKISEKRTMPNEILLSKTRDTVKNDLVNLTNSFKTVIQNVEKTEISISKIKEDLNKVLEKIITMSKENFESVPTEIAMLSKHLDGTLKLKRKSDQSPSKQEAENVSNKLECEALFIEPPDVRRSARVEASKTYSELRASYCNLKSPTHSSGPKPLQHTRSNCYTPKSLTTCIEDQVRDIFDVDNSF